MDRSSEQGIGINTSQKADQGKPSAITRRNFLRLAGLSVVGLGSARLGINTLRNSDALRASETLAETPIEYGFTQLVYVDGEIGGNQNPEMFKKCIDILAENNQSWIRTNVWDWEIASYSDDGTIIWNERNANAYLEALKYAHEKGVKVCLIGNTPVAFKDLSRESYLTATGEYFTHLAEMFGPYVETWQLFNEADIHSHRDYSIVHQGFHDTDGWSSRLAEFADVVRVASESIKSVRPHTRTAVNSAASWYGDDEHRVVSEFFDAVADYVDELHLSYYPYDDRAAIRNLPKSIEYYKTRYPEKRVVVSELGVSTGAGFSPDDQRSLLANALASLQGGKVRPDGIFLFSLTDRGGTPDPVEAGYGLLDVDGYDKGAFEKLTSTFMQNTSDDNQG